MAISISEQKKQQRIHCLAVRRSMTSEMKASASRKICEQLLALPEISDTGIILSYLPAEDEADVSAFNASMEAAGKEVAYPISLSGGVMLAAIPEKGAIESGRFGIRSPIRERSKIIKPEEIALIIVPCVGFDEGGGRLGHGAGYYDRYFLKCPKAIKIMVAFETQKLSAVATEETDAAVPITVTEKAVYRS